MRRRLQDRVIVLETRQLYSAAHQRSVPHWLYLIIALEVGDLRPEEPIACGYARALGFPEVQEFRKRLVTRDPSLMDRHYQAVDDLLRRAGANRSEPEVVEHAVNALLEKHAREVAGRLGTTCLQ